MAEEGEKRSGEREERARVGKLIDSEFGNSRSIIKPTLGPVTTHLNSTIMLVPLGRRREAMDMLWVAQVIIHGMPHAGI